MKLFAATFHRLLLGLLITTLLCSSLAAGQKNDTTSTPKASAVKPQGFGGSYDTLLPAQKRLVDEYFGRASTALGKKIDPETAYNSLRVSVRSTFDAVTHALAKTQLTGDDGKKYGSAVDLVDIVEEVAGERKGASGDEQFRLYVLMRPDAYDVLSKVKQFDRKPDNTIYHKGYPICFRSVPAVPSIQVSMTRDHARADIDVDYRSSKFPAAVVNGHLTASNSDVRASNNLERHDNRWTGLSGWWRDLFGLPAAKPSVKQSWLESAVAISPKGDPDQLTHDLLTTWLVDQNIGEASSYFSRQVYPCAEAQSRNKGGKVTPGIGRFLLLMELANGAKVVGQIDKLSPVVSAPANPYDQLKPEKNKYESEFLLLKVPEDQAGEFRCKEEANATREAAKEEGDQDYVASVIRIKPPERAEVVLLLLWGKESKKYRVMSARVVDAGDSTLEAYGSKRPPAPAETPLATVEGDKQFNTTIQDFFTTWLLKNNSPQATTFFAPSSYACMPPEKASQGAKALTATLIDIRKKIGARQSLQDYLQPVVPDDPELKRVVHENDNAYTIVAMPGTEAQSFSCNKTKKLSADAPYYGSVFRFRTTDGNDPATLYVVWGKQDDAWKVVAWRVISVG